MKIALIGGTGFVGSAVLTELLSRGHQVTALARKPAKFVAQPGLTVVAADVLDAAQVAQAVMGVDAVISAYNPGWTEPRIAELTMLGSQSVEMGTQQAGVRRLLVVGGAGSLFVAPGLQLVDAPGFPTEIKVAASAARDVLARMQQTCTLDWTFVSPPIALAPGVRSGQYRVGGDTPLPGEGDAPSGITVADLAVAIVDEIETPKHVKKRFTVAN